MWDMLYRETKVAFASTNKSIPKMNCLRVHAAGRYQAGARLVSNEAVVVQC